MSEQPYGREHGSSSTETRSDGSIAHFGDPTDGIEADAPDQLPEAGTTIPAPNNPDSTGGNANPGDADVDPDGASLPDPQEPSA